MEERKKEKTCPDNNNNRVIPVRSLSHSYLHSSRVHPPPPTTTTTTTSSSSSSSLHYAPVTSSSSMMDIDSLVEDRSRRATSVLSMDDIEAAQALEGLRSEYGQSPRASSQRILPPTATPTTTTTSSPSQSKQQQQQHQQQPEPILSLLTSTHPLISSAINGSMSAYTSSKSYSRRFKCGAEFIERNIGSPVANTVGTVGRKTGVESGLRWALQRRGSASVDANRSKRRKVNWENSSNDHPDEHDNGTADVDVEEKGRREDPVLSHRNRMRSSSDLSYPESLPPYDDLKSPSYDEVGGTTANLSADGRQTPPTWQSRLMISTSGLGVAMSEESLRSLQYCLAWLRWANGRLCKAIVALKDALKEWDDSKLHQLHQQDLENASTANRPDSLLLSQRIQVVKEDVLSTLKQVVAIVSKYAGGALPENARNLVRRHLTSLPQRFQIASLSNSTPSDPSVPLSSSADATTVGAHRVLVLAQEGLDIMAQVSRVVNDTLVSAEHWCERLGKKRPNTTKNGADAPQEQRRSQCEQRFVADVKEPVTRNEPFVIDVKYPVVSQGPDVHMTGMERV